MMGAAVLVAAELARFERRYVPQCACWRVDGLRQERGALECAVCSRVVVPAFAIAKGEVR